MVQYTPVPNSNENNDPLASAFGIGGNSNRNSLDSIDSLDEYNDERFSDVESIRPGSDDQASPRTELDSHSSIVGQFPSNASTAANITTSTSDGNTSGVYSQVPTESNNGSSSSNRQVRGNDGVFSNITASTDFIEKNDDTPPTYDEAAADATPPYWETTIMTSSGFGDEVFVDGLPVGTPLNFLWNLAISVAFQVVGFLLTYLLHTSHAAKQGSRAGLGFTILQFGYFMLLGQSSGKENTEVVEEFEPSDPNDFNISSATAHIGGTTTIPSSSLEAVDSAYNKDNIIAYGLMLFGALMIVFALLDYYRAIRMERIIRQEPERPQEFHNSESPENMV
ncbi:hypothetical protein NADFUDRAFT_83782 [Nadsonia fulvescens var. elongata DSM 6958]|uniref:Metal homeostatis protein BSD2 n=1 Tax=Nadsonia fulvescens var. elongata DSM 6958 TaxID=857566 RepID=A0A1E3PG85_9ASCO|nr:hypothetical protein NADFUDRAFT_83782 [Nadsonia fulvescens var. elongata DSM 6958]